ncbi:MAG TPA: glycosyltransferase [Candidatus Binatia bacterium]|nr:glycosyltransferase [Candidatus Binatia bacterium]
MTLSENQLGHEDRTIGRQLKVLFLIDRLHCTEGGAEGVVHKLCSSLPQYGFHCMVATFWAGEGVTQKFPCPVHIFPLTSIYRRKALGCAKDFASLLRRERVEILHTFFPASDLWGGMVARLSGCPVVISSRRDMGILRSRKHSLSYRLANRLFDQVQAVSDTVREFCIVRDRIPAGKVVTVYNGVDLDAIDAAASADRRLCFGADDGQQVISTVANIRQVKGIDILVQAAAQVVRKIPDTIFAIIGGAIQEPAYWEAVQAAIKSMGLQRNFRFLGTRSDVFSLLKQSDIFCLPSRSEGMSNALLEAMACRLPCVATRVGGNPEVVVDGESGYLVPSEDSSALAARVISLLGNHERSRQMGQEGRHLVESKFTVHHMAQRLSQLYGDLLRRRGLISVSSAVPLSGPRRDDVPSHRRTSLTC